MDESEKESERDAIPWREMSFGSLKSTAFNVRKRL